MTYLDRELEKGSWIRAELYVENTSALPCGSVVYCDAKLKFIHVI